MAHPVRQFHRSSDVLYSTGWMNHRTNDINCGVMLFVFKFNHPDRQYISLQRAVLQQVVLPITNITIMYGCPMSGGPPWHAT